MQTYTEGRYAGINYYLDGPLPKSPVWKGEFGWYIAMGFAGFNSPANNRSGYSSSTNAVNAIRRYQAGGARNPS